MCRVPYLDGDVEPLITLRGLGQRTWTHPWLPTDVCDPFPPWREPLPRPWPPVIDEPFPRPPIINPRPWPPDPLPRPWPDPFPPFVPPYPPLPPIGGEPPYTRYVPLSFFFRLEVAKICD